MLLVAEAPPTATEGFLSVLGTGGLVVSVLIIVFLAVLRVMRRSAERKVQLYQTKAGSRGVNGPGQVALLPGWYPTPAGDQDRYFDGSAWTENYRDHTADSNVNDPAPSDLVRVEVPVEPDPTPIADPAVEEALASTPAWTGLAAEDRLYPDLTEDEQKDSVDD